MRSPAHLKTRQKQMKNMDLLCDTFQLRDIQRIYKDFKGMSSDMRLRTDHTKTNTHTHTNTRKATIKSEDKSANLGGDDCTALPPRVAFIIYIGIPYHGKSLAICAAVCQGVWSL